MTELYPEIEPYEHGFLDVGDGNHIYWAVCGAPAGKPAVVVHGGPGSGAHPGFRQFFDPERYHVVLFDQRNCGRSTPHAADPAASLEQNTTQNLVADIERLREHLGIERWLLLGGSWGSTLGLAYAEAHPDRVTEIVLFGVTTGRHSEFEWTFRGGLARFFPEQWERLAAFVAPASSGREVVESYNRLLGDVDPAIRRRAAEEWCLWESVTPAWPPREGLAERYRDPEFAVAFARIVTHYVVHDAWLEDGELLRGATALSGIPGILVNGRFDFQAPIENAWTLQRAWPRAEIVIVPDAGHATNAPLNREVVRATDRFAER